jgi:hypothetical protein
MISKILIWVGFSVMILCVCAVVVFAALGCVTHAIFAACIAILLALVCRREADALNEWQARHPRD